MIHAGYGMSSNANIHTQPTPVIRLAVILGALATFGPFGIDMYLSGFERIAADFETGVANVQISLSVYFLGLAVGQLIYGPLADRFGRIRPMLAGLAVFSSASFLLTVLPTIESFIAFRLVQAVGGCSGMIIGRAMVRDCFDLKQSAHVFSSLAIVQGMGPVAAPIIGSLMLSVWSWHSVFIFVGFYGLACLAAVAFGLKETLPPGARREVTFSQTFRDYAELARHRTFMVPALAGSLGGAALFAYIGTSSFVFMTLYGMSSRQFALIFASNAAGNAIFAQINRLLLKRFSPHRIMLHAMIFELAAIAVLFTLSGGAPMFVFMIPLWFAIAALPMIYANSIALAMRDCRGKAGIASAILGLMQFGLASLASGLTGLFHTESAYPMAGVMFAVVLAGLLVLILGERKTQTPPDDHLADEIEIEQSENETF